MHSSQMYTPGPAMSFLTCFWLFPQKEHFSRSPPSPNFATDASPGFRPSVPTRSAHAGRDGHGRKLTVRDDLVDHPVLLRLERAHDEVPVGVVAYPFGGLPGVMGQQLVEGLAHPRDLLGLDLDVHGLTRGTTVRLVDQHPGV